jgi:hypothetical protein
MRVVFLRSSLINDARVQNSGSLKLDITLSILRRRLMGSSGNEGDLAGLFPCGMLVRKLLALMVEMHRVVMDIEELSRHGEKMPNAREKFRSSCEECALNKRYA